MSEIWPETTADEQDPREDQEENTKREKEIAADKPPHHE